jgi:hypothetical protein
MTKKLKLVFLVFLLPYLAFSQEESFIELDNGTIIKGELIQFKMDVSNKPFLLVDGTTKYELYQQVKAYQIKGKYFKKVFDPSSERMLFYFRTAHGKIDAYKKASNKRFWHGDTPFLDNKWDLYSIDNGPLKKVNFRSLKNDLKESPDAMIIIKS